MFSRFTAAITSPTQTVSDLTSNVHSTVTSTYTKAVNKLNDYPYLSDTKTSITSTFNDGTNYISSIPSTVYSYTSMFQPVNADEEETPRSPPRHNMASDEVSPLSDDRVKLVEDILDLYCLKFSSKCFDHYDENVTFSDPLTHTTGISNLKALFYWMPKMFNKSTTVSYKITENSFDTLKIDLYQRYTLPYVSRTVTHHSVIILEFNQDKKIVKHTDYWGGKPFNREVILPLRKGAAKLVSTLVSVPSEEN